MKFCSLKKKKNGLEKQKGFLNTHYKRMQNSQTDKFSEKDIYKFEYREQQKKKQIINGMMR